MKYTSSNSGFDADSEYNISFVQIIIFLTETSKIWVKKAQIYAWKPMWPCLFECFVKPFFQDLGKGFVEPKMLYIMHYIKNPPDWLWYKKMTYIEKKSVKKSTNF